MESVNKIIWTETVPGKTEVFTDGDVDNIYFLNDGLNKCKKKSPYKSDK